MNRIQAASVLGSEGVRAETQHRDASFVMSGHHCHSCYELFCVHSGACRFLLEDRLYDLQAGDFLLIPPMVLHYTRYVFGDCVRTVILFHRNDIGEDTMACMPGPESFFTETSVFHVPENERAQIAAVLQQMVMEDIRDDSCSAPLRKYGLQQLLLLCCRVCDFPREEMGGIRTTDPHIIRAARHISRYYASPITTEDVAREVGFSPNYLSRKFRQAAGIGLHEYIVYIRLYHAAQELLTTSDSITTIALRCGFSDSNYFKDSFKKKYGVTPRGFRKLA